MIEHDLDEALATDFVIGHHNDILTLPQALNCLVQTKLTRFTLNVSTTFSNVSLLIFGLFPNTHQF